MRKKVMTEMTNICGMSTTTRRAMYSEIRIYAITHGRGDRCGVSAGTGTATRPVAIDLRVRVAGTAASPRRRRRPSRDVPPSTLALHCIYFLPRIPAEREL